MQDENKKLTPQAQEMPESSQAQAGIVAEQEAQNPEAAQLGEKPKADTVNTSETPASKEKKAAKGNNQQTDFHKKIWEPILRPIVALVSICLITSLLLGITNEITKPIIEENTRVTAENTRKELLPDATGFKEVTLSPKPEKITAMYEAENGVGYIIESYGNGYKGKVPAIVALDASGTVVGVRFLKNDESPGLGSELYEKDFIARQFSGHDNTLVGPGEIDGIAGATISTNAAVAAVNAALELYNEKIGGAISQNLTPEEIRAMLLPDAKSIVPVPVSIENVTEAYKGDDGNYIIYAQAPGIYKDPVTVAAALTPEGVILGLWMDTSAESEGYGKELSRNKEFVEQFIGHTLTDLPNEIDPKNPGVIDAVADVTRSCNSVLQAVRTALQALPTVEEAA